MANKKNFINATPEQIEQLENALRGGSPLLLALQYAGISRTTFYYWVAMASIVETVKSQEELEKVEKYMQSGVSLQTVRDLSETAASTKRTSVGAFVEPSAESILQYKNSRKFRKFADQCYEIISECNRIRSGVALTHLLTIKKSTDKGQRINASGSMWFLERQFSDFFSKPNEKAAEDNKDLVVEPIKVEYVEPNSQETRDRVEEMERDIMESYKAGGRA